MKTNTVTIELDSDLVELFRDLHGRPEQKLKEYLVLELFRRHEISGDRAAAWLGTERNEFIRYASHLGVPCPNLDEKELQQESYTAQGLA